MPRNRFLKATSVMMLAGGLVSAQRDDRTPADRMSGLNLSALAPGRDPADIAEAVDVLDNYTLGFLYYALPPESVKSTFKDFLKSVEAARVDQQLGANPSTGASSSVVAKAGLTSLVSFALETGAITQTVDQNVVTLHANGDGLFRFLSGQDVIAPCVSGSLSCKPSWASGLDLSASFNISNGGTKTLTGQTAGTAAPVDISTIFNNHQFSSATAQYAILNKRDLRSKAYHDSFLKWFGANKVKLTAAGNQLLTSVSTLFDPMQKSPEYSAWLTATRDAINKAIAANPKSVPDVFDTQLKDLVAKMRALDAQFDSKLQGLEQAYARYFATQDQLGRNMITAPQLLLLATYSEPPLQPKIINTKFSFAMSPGSRDLAACGNAAPTTKTQPVDLTNGPACANPGTFTINGGIDVYQTEQPTGVAQNTSRFRDAQVAIQFDRPLGAATSPAQLSIGAYYQYQRNPGIFTVPSGATTIPNSGIPLTPAGTTVLTNTKGSLYVAQAMVTLQIPAAGLKMPIGISWSKRTDLVRGNEVRGHIGFTFNSEGPLLSAK